MKKKVISALSGLAVGVLASTVFFGNFSTPDTVSTASAKTDAEKVYVPFGEKDEYYLFASGGHSGANVYLRGAVDAAHSHCPCLFA